MKLARREKRTSDSLTPTLEAWSPFRRLSRLHEELDRLFEEPFSAPLMAGWSPAVDVHEDENNVYVMAEIPGMKKDDINVSVSDGMLSIAGERKEETEHKSENSYRSERFFGQFQRDIPLPSPVQPDKIEATYKDGVLSITCPKTDEGKRRHVEIKVE